MRMSLSAMGYRVGGVFSRVLTRLGLGVDSYLIVVAIAVGVLTAAAAVGFHELIRLVRATLYLRVGESLYSDRLYLLLLWPTLGGLAVGILGTWVFRSKGGHGVVDVMESVIRSSRFVRPGSAIEKMLTSAVTIGSGGAVGAEGPIVQIGAAVSTLAGKAFGVSRPNMPAIVGCGTAAGISAIFNAPIGGLLFTLEVILQDFSIRTIAPIVVASVVANTTTQALFAKLHSMGYGEPLTSIFTMPPALRESPLRIELSHLPNIVLLGAVCGVLAVVLIRTLFAAERQFASVRIPAALRPAMGGLALGAMGVGYILAFRGGTDWLKPIPFEIYPMPGFFGDGYAVIQQMLRPAFYEGASPALVIGLLATLLAAKLLATPLTLGSGGSGGVIAPSLFVGAAAGGLLGMVLPSLPMLPPVRPEVYALVGMAAALAAVVHAPLAAVLILTELTADSQLVLPAMLAAVSATGVARLLFPYSVYTYDLRRRGLRLTGTTESLLMHRLLVEQAELDPADVVPAAMPASELVRRYAALDHPAEWVAVDRHGSYLGLITPRDVEDAGDSPEALLLIVCGDLMRPGVPYVLSTDTLAAVQDQMLRHGVQRLAVCLPAAPGRVIGQVSFESIRRAAADVADSRETDPRPL